MSLLLLIIGLLMFIGLVVVHEYGHFIMARRGGVEVEEFGIGFPPKAKTLTVKNGTEYTLNWLPLGGFVRLKGENDSSEEPGSFGAAKLSTKIKIMLAGVVMNLGTAFVMLTFLALIGMPKLIDNQFTIASDTHIVKHNVLIGQLEPGGPADKAGLQPQDHILRIEGEGNYGEDTFNVIEHIEDASRLPTITKSFAGKEVTIDYVRQGDVRGTKVKLRTSEEVDASKKTDNPKGHLGISPAEYIVQRSTWSAPIVAAGFIKQVTELTFKGLGTALGSLFKGDTATASSQVAGPIGIFVLLQDGSLLGYQFILMIIAIISLTLAIMNVLPIPALDGGRLFVTLLFRAMRRPLKRKTEELIHGTGFMALMLLFVLITIVDIKRFF